jgi:hypothetical protein
VSAVHSDVAICYQRCGLCAGYVALLGHKQIEANVAVRLDCKLSTFSRAQMSPPAAAFI